ncbi:MAG: hypothetical protein ABJG15_03250 [Hyphomonadaceae bacterium]
MRYIGLTMAIWLAGASSGIAQTCAITELGPEIGEIYLQAQKELVVNDNPSAAIAGLNTLQAKTLNCYEEGAVLGLSAQIKLRQENYLGAAVDLRTSLDKGYIPVTDRPRTLKALSQIYFAENQYDDGLKFMNEWIVAGGQPSRDEMWTLATVYTIQEGFGEAVPWAEQVLEIDGADADRKVYDLLEHLYGETDQIEKRASLLKLQRENAPLE